MFWYKFLNYFFFCFHSLLIVFNTFGWSVKKLRRWNLFTLLLTAGSWFVLGIWYGWGYCVCIDWHWKVREHLGYHNMSNSYIKFLLLKLTGINFPSHMVDFIVAVVFFASLVISLILNGVDYIKNQRSG